MTNNRSFPVTALSVPLFVDLAKVPSTNSALAGIPEAPAFSVVTASHQSAGRGRKDRQWVSEPGGSIAVSVALPVDFPDPLPSSWVPLVVGLAMVDALKKLGVADVGMKWPNDILVGDHKLGGVLCEMDARSVVVAGVGINTHFAASPPTPHSTSLSQHIALTSRTPDDLIARFVGNLRSLRALHPETITRRASTAMLTLGREVEVVEAAGVVWRGFAEELDESGHLMVRHSEGRLVAVAAADVWHLRQ